MHYDYIEVPAKGEAITANPDHTLNVPDRPIIPYIEGPKFFEPLINSVKTFFIFSILTLF